MTNYDYSTARDHDVLRDRNNANDNYNANNERVVAPAASGGA